MRMLRSLSLLAGLVALLGCHTVDVAAEYDPKQTYSFWRTYAWRSLVPTVEGTHLDARMIDQRLRAAIASGLNEHGYRQVDAEPDFLVSYQLAVAETTTTQQVQQVQFVDAAWGAARNRTVQTTYDAGTLVINLADRREPALAWRGTARGRAERSSDAEAVARSLEAVVDEVLANFPPQEGL